MLSLLLSISNVKIHHPGITLGYHPHNLKRAVMQIPVASGKNSSSYSFHSFWSFYMITWIFVTLKCTSVAITSLPLRSPWLTTWWQARTIRPLDISVRGLRNSSHSLAFNFMIIIIIKCFLPIPCTPAACQFPITAATPPHALLRLTQSPSLHQTDPQHCWPITSIENEVQKVLCKERGM